MAPSYNSLKIVTWDCTKWQADFRRPNASAAHATELQARVGALEEPITNPTEEKTLSSPTGSTSNGTVLATSKSTLQNASHLGYGGIKIPG